MPLPPDWYARSEHPSGYRFSKLVVLVDQYGHVLIARNVDRQVADRRLA